MLTGNPGYFSDGLNGANLVVGVHDRNQYRSGCDHVPDVVGVNSPETIYGQVGHLGT